MPADFIDIHLDILRDTTAAWQVSDGDVTVWLPKSQVDTDGMEVGDSGLVSMPEWLAVERGLA
jgi:hypothetical protein